ncbi:hypothetical protein Q4488_17335 [Amphritea sp. 1_MG-2023]|uniref:hypothetical protein n=1 Tax=Amphritea sp. 1_MG-2023 TaxID=3062670 RepID=UPI0026E3E32F|nr:hypothetical protein [Amphritea sp. 1_MG-2023]MDO6565143.1 hypothetical protein [Amphritea sp. 1_MG-2023]
MKNYFSLVFIYCLFSFKINLVGEFRLDDVLAFSLIIIFLSANNKNLFFDKPVILMLAFIALSLFSSLYNSLVEHINFIRGFLFSIRHFEYLIFIVLGFFLASWGCNFTKILKVYVIYALGLIMLQKLGVIAPVSGFSASRAIANTGGPWELAAIAAFLLLYFHEKKLWLYFGLSFLILFLTESRVTLAAVLVVFLFKFIRKDFIKSVFVATFASFFVVILLLFVSAINANVNSKGLSNIVIFERVSDAFSSETFNSIVLTLNAITVVETQEEYWELGYGDGLKEILKNDGDLSTVIRFARWVVLVPTTLNGFDSTLIGLGPSFAGKAVDGNYIRLFIETGLIGLFIYLSFVFAFIKKTRLNYLSNYMIVIALTATFIDIFTTYKALMVLWVFYGKFIYDTLQNRNQFKRI